MQCFDQDLLVEEFQGVVQPGTNSTTSTGAAPSASAALSLMCSAAAARVSYLGQLLAVSRTKGTKRHTLMPVPYEAQVQYFSNSRNDHQAHFPQIANDI
eukprot:3517946-Amphidinium_carterae.2